jgi:hypothetical protein
MRAALLHIYRSFPVQLLLLHLRTNYLLLLMWGLLLAMMSGYLGASLGLQYLFLDPEYLGETGYYSFVILGMAFGFFTMSWNLSTYLLLGGYFNFLASLSRPFFKFCINNAVLPLTVFLTYVILLLGFHPQENWAGSLLWGWGPRISVVQAVSGLIVGLVLSLFIYSIYFNLTNRDITYYTGARDLPPNRGPSQRGGLGYRPYRSSALGPRLVNLYDNPFRVRTYLGARLRPRPVRSVAHYETDLLRNIFRQNHLNALIVQFLTVLVLVVLGLLIEWPAFQIPAGASFLVLFSLFVSIIGAVSYWFSAWRLTLLLLLAVFINWLTSTPYFEHGNQAYGLRYDSTATYSLERLRQLASPANRAADRAATIEILERWKAKQTTERPKLVVLCASGGGLTASLWATHLTQSIEACSDGQLLRSTALMTGASGGMLGLAYLREAYRDQSTFPFEGLQRLKNASEDLLNPVAFSIVSNDIFLPFRRIRVGDERYRRDRGYAFERAYNIATDYALARPLADYREPERLAEIPLMFLTPSVVEDGRRMVISPQGVSYMMVPPVAAGRAYPLGIDMVDFGRLLDEQEADSLRFSTALRANASYPYVLPQVRLPTEPIVRLMDAGYRDNYGITSAARFLHVFHDWIEDNTAGVVLVQISAFREQRLPESGQQGVVAGLFSPLGVAGNILSLQILDQEELLAGLYRSFGRDRFHLFRFNYQPSVEDPLRTSVSLHMTESEKAQVLRAFDTPERQRRIDELIQLLR